MKYTTHLRKLALLSSLALSFGVQADGTLPLPVAKEELPLAMSGNAEGQGAISLSIQKLQNIPNRNPEILPNGVSPCSTGDIFYEASGSILVDTAIYAVQGVCAPEKNLETVARRLLVATDGTIGVGGTSTKLVRLDGTVAASGVVTLSSFSGKLSIQTLGAPATPLMTTMSLTSASLPGLVTLNVSPQAATVPTVYKFQLLRK